MLNLGNENKYFIGVWLNLNLFWLFKYLSIFGYGFNVLVFLNGNLLVIVIIGLNKICGYRVFWEGEFIVLK